MRRNYAIQDQQQVNAGEGGCLLDTVSMAVVEKLKSVSVGNNLRLESEKFIGAGLEFGDQIIQFTT
ncbi:MAG: hypothetical protein ACLPVO_01060 [Desulfomonilaceae bacterium]